MSRTYRNNPEDKYYRTPKTKQEKTQNVGLETDEHYEHDYHVAKQNRRHRFIPSAWDDIPISR